DRSGMSRRTVRQETPINPHRSRRLVQGLLGLSHPVKLTSVIVKHCDYPCQAGLQTERPDLRPRHIPPCCNIPCVRQCRMRHRLQLGEERCDTISGVWDDRKVKDPSQMRVETLRCFEHHAVVADLAMCL